MKTDTQVPQPCNIKHRVVVFQPLRVTNYSASPSNLLVSLLNIKHKVLGVKLYNRVAKSYLSSHQLPADKDPRM